VKYEGATYVAKNEYEVDLMDRVALEFAKEYFRGDNIRKTDKTDDMLRAWNATAIFMLARSSYEDKLEEKYGK
jgi:hypothetical protein